MKHHVNKSFSKALHTQMINRYLASMKLKLVSPYNTNRAAPITWHFHRIQRVKLLTQHQNKK